MSAPAASPLDSQHHLPRVERSWTIGTVLAASCSLVSVLVVIFGAIWAYAGVSYAAQNIPSLQVQQASNTRDIAVLKANQTNSDTRYAEILNQLVRLNDKVDRNNEAASADKKASRWPR